MDANFDRSTSMDPSNRKVAADRAPHLQRSYRRPRAQELKRRYGLWSGAEAAIFGTSIAALKVRVAPSRPSGPAGRRRRRRRRRARGRISEKRLRRDAGCLGGRGASDGAGERTHTRRCAGPPPPPPQPAHIPPIRAAPAWRALGRPGPRLGKQRSFPGATPELSSIREFRRSFGAELHCGSVGAFGV